ncbi:MAG: alpha/beta hydrolase [Lachnospiraceae bacterium]|nr:alpha/beta hydrolase [Lachnospiraceae bacterium]
MDDKEKVLEPTIRMAVADAIPVICFAASMVLICHFYNTVIIEVWAVLCVLAGLGKVLWKLILAVSHRDRAILNKQFRYLMTAGAILIVVSVIVRRPSLAVIWKNIASFPCNLLFVIAVAAFVVMGILDARMDMTKQRANRIEQTINLIAQICILLGVVIIWYASDYYRADADVDAYLVSTDTVEVTEIRNGIFFDGSGTEKALVFYPGAKVEYTAYAPLMMELADAGIDCFLLEMPYNMAVFGINRANSVISDYSYDQWYLSGHSLGGSMAASYAAKHTEELGGCIMLAAYATKSLGDLPVLAIYGSEDGVLNLENLEEGRQYAVNYTEICIEGGNHAGFGAYGPQAGDGAATISREEQWRLTVDAVTSDNW